MKIEPEILARRHNDSCLIVDDDPDVIDILTQFLTRLGFGSITAVEDRRNGKRLVQEGGYRVVIIDGGLNYEAASTSKCKTDGDGYEELLDWGQFGAHSATLGAFAIHYMDRDTCYQAHYPEAYDKRWSRDLRSLVYIARQRNPHSAIVLYSGSGAERFTDTYDRRIMNAYLTKPAEIGDFDKIFRTVKI